MNSPIILGNWKAHKSISEANDWIAYVSQRVSDIPSHCTVILCPAYHHLELFSRAKLPIQLGIQDLSQFSGGAYTGEITAAMVRGIVSYALIGHSERINHFGVTDETVSQKAQRAVEQDIIPVVCVSGPKQAEELVHYYADFIGKGMLLYEPLSAIGTGKPASPVHANDIAMELKHSIPDVPVLYGGSVTPETVGSYVSQKFIAGVGVGGARLDPQEFLSLIQKVKQEV